MASKLYHFLQNYVMSTRGCAQTVATMQQFGPMRAGSSHAVLSDERALSIAIADWLSQADFPQMRIFLPPLFW